MSKWPYELFGIECGPGWASLYEPLMKMCKEEGVEIHQIKEKFGGLRFYTGPASEELNACISIAEMQSYDICEECGEPGELRGGGWIRTLCDIHAEGREPLPKGEFL